MTREPVFNKNFIKQNLGVIIKFLLFTVPIGTAKKTDEIQFHPAAPVIKYYQKLSTSCC